MTVKLIEALKAIEASDAVEPAYCLTDGYHDELHPLVQAAVNEADGALIDSRGGCNSANHRVLKEHGFPVRCGERDSFGWLTGLIQTKKGIVAYG